MASTDVMGFVIEAILKRVSMVIGSQCLQIHVSLTFLIYNSDRFPNHADYSARFFIIYKFFKHFLFLSEISGFLSIATNERDQFHPEARGKSPILFLWL